MLFTDGSESMNAGMAMERGTAEWSRKKAEPGDGISFLDFGSDLCAMRSPLGSVTQTALYDSVLKATGQFPRSCDVEMLFAIVLLTDGDDNYNLHGLSK